MAVIWASLPYPQYVEKSVCHL